MPAFVKVRDADLLRASGGRLACENPWTRPRPWRRRAAPGVESPGMV